MTDDVGPGAIPAATLIVARDRPGGAPQLLMVERAEGMAFAAGALVFPGGRIDETDRELALRLGVEAPAIAAIRETIEETAVPIALTSPPRPEHMLKIQAALADGKDFASIAEQAGLEINAGALTPFARWVPKFHAVRRFDTLFYIAAAPPGDWRSTPISRRSAPMPSPIRSSR